MSEWHLDKKIPISIIIALIIQSISFVWFMSKQDSRIGYLEAIANSNKQSHERLVRLETNTENIQYSIRRIERVLEKAQ